jgi:hypothetical protein
MAKRPDVIIRERERRGWGRERTCKLTDVAISIDVAI